MNKDLYVIHKTENMRDSETLRVLAVTLNVIKKIWKTVGEMDPRGS